MAKRGTIIGGAAATAAGGLAAGVCLAARRGGVSVSAFLLNALAARLAPDQNRPGALERGIEQNRKTGPALPSRKLLKRALFRDERVGSDRRFRFEPRHGPPPRLRLLYLHGGAYVHEVQSIQWNLAAGLLERLPAALIAPVYPLAPEHSWKEGLAAVERAYVSLTEEVGADNVVIVGDSAGGGLALALAQQLRDAGHAPPAALVLFSPWLDVSVSGDDQPRLEKRDPVLRIEYLRQAGRLWARDLPLTDPRVSPLLGDHTGLPPTIAFSGGRDILASDCNRLAQRNQELVHRHYPEMMHVWASAPMPEGKRALDEAARFIEQHTTHAVRA
jgi:acetyl esterase/lipase